jgi:hypothetical protein
MLCLLDPCLTSRTLPVEDQQSAFDLWPLRQSGDPVPGELRHIAVQALRHAQAHRVVGVHQGDLNPDF